MLLNSNINSLHCRNTQKGIESETKHAFDAILGIFFMANPQNIALAVDETTSSAFRLHSGYSLIAAGILDGGTFPTSVKLQMRFSDGKGSKVEWFDTDVEFDAPGADTIFASPLVEYRISADAAGAIVHYSEIKVNVN